MTDVSALDLPELDVASTDLRGPEFRAAMDALAQTSWLARMPLGYITLDRESGEHFLRSRTATFPGHLVAEAYGVEDGPLRQEIDHNILHLDGADHARLRRLVNPFFTPRAADQWRPAMRCFLQDLWPQVQPGGDIVKALAEGYPALTIGAVLGAPPEDAPKIHEWSHWVQRQFDGPSLMSDRARIEQAVVELYDWISQLLAARRGDAGDDLVSALIAAEQEGDRLSDVELVNLVLNVLIGGVDTTVAQLAHGLRLFAEHPEQWELLAREPERVPRAVDEVLRHEPITPFTARILTEDETYRDVGFPAGTVIMIGAVTGNLDAAGDPAFDITADRSGARLMTFGAGIHHCLGMNLARAELEEALLFLPPRMPGLRLAAEPGYGSIQGVYGLESLHLTWERAGAGSPARSRPATSPPGPRPAADR